MDYVLFGIQGSGKGTQGKFLAPKISASYFETGGELRRLSKEDSELGKKVKSIIEAGHLVQNEVVMEIVENFIKTNPNAGNPIIFDGIPRNGEQNGTFEALLNKMGRKYTGLYFELSKEEAENSRLEYDKCMATETEKSNFNAYQRIFDDNGEFIDPFGGLFNDWKCRDLLKKESSAVPAQPERVWYRKATDDEYDFCLHEKGLK